MTNEQLKIILEQQVALLEQAIEKSAELMPEGAERFCSTDQCIRASINVMNGDIGQSEEEPGGKFYAHRPIYEHLAILRRHIRNLETE